MEALRWGRKTTRGGLSRDTLPRYCTLVFLFAQYSCIGHCALRGRNAVERRRVSVEPGRYCFRSLLHHRGLAGSVRATNLFGPGTRWRVTRLCHQQRPGGPPPRAGTTRDHGECRGPAECAHTSHSAFKIQPFLTVLYDIRFLLPALLLYNNTMVLVGPEPTATENCVSRSSAGATTDK